MREAALVAIESLLLGISLVKKVSRQFEDIQSLATTSFPCLIIEDDGDEVIERKTGGFADVTFSINIFGYVKDNENLSTAMNTLDVALKKAIGADTTLGNTVVYVEVMPYVERSGTEHRPFGYFVRPLQITYEGTTTAGL